MNHDLELSARSNVAPLGMLPQEEAGDAFFEDLPPMPGLAGNDPAQLYPVNVSVVTPGGPQEVWVYRVAAHNYDEAQNKIARIFEGSKLQVARILVLPPLPGGYEFVASQVRQ